MTSVRRLPDSLRVCRHFAMPPSCFMLPILPTESSPSRASWDFRGEALTLDAVARERLRRPVTVRAAMLVAGVGAPRALMIESTAAASLRQLLTPAAAPLGPRSAHVLWTVIASSASGG